MKRSPEEIEQLVHQALRAMPERRAPRALESRVMAELARRAALPWWRQSFPHWPVAARGGFLLLIAGVVKLLLFAAVFVQAGFDSGEFTKAFAPQVAVLERTFNVGTWIVDFASTVYHAIPPLWLYGGAAVFAGLYVSLFGIGAAAYRALYASR